ncbi:MAG: hypothetical protein WD534_07885 [Phycisphaeraceae bacterium]
MARIAGAGKRPLISTDEQGRLTTDLLCQQCRYNLRTLPADATCPECGEAVATTVQAANDHAHAGPWLRQLYSGVKCMLTAQLCFLGGILGAFAAGEGAFVLGILMGLLLMGIAMFLLATPGSRAMAYGWRRRHQYVANGLLALTVVGMFLLLGMTGKGPNSAQVMIAAGMSTAAGFFGTLTLLLWHGRLVARWLDRPMLSACSLTLAVAVAMMGVTLLGAGTGAWLTHPSGPRLIDRQTWWAVDAWLWPIWGTTTCAVYITSAALLVAFIVTFRRALAEGDAARRRQDVY